VRLRVLIKTHITDQSNDQRYMQTLTEQNRQLLGRVSEERIPKESDETEENESDVHVDRNVNVGSKGALGTTNLRITLER